MVEFIATKKTMDRLGSTVSESRSAPVSNFARKAMEKMGWVEGEGLGKNSDGIAEHIKIKKREDAAGLGTEKMLETAGPSENWWADAYSSNLKTMQKKNKKKKDRGEKSDKSDKSDKKARKKSEKNKKESSAEERPPTMEELFVATGGARLGMRARADQKGKLLRVEGTGYDPNAAVKLAAKIIENVNIIPLSTDSVVEVDADDSEAEKKKLKKQKKEKKRSRDDHGDSNASHEEKKKKLK